MIRRTTLQPSSSTTRAKDGGNYFAQAHTDVEFVSTGSKLLDLALGGGWAEDRVSNIVGDKSTGKTLLAMESTSNFARKYPNGSIDFREIEPGFLKEYARALGMPIERVNFGDKKKPMRTVEDLYDDLCRVIDRFGDKKSQFYHQPTWYVIDSLDALSDDAEMERAFDKGTYGGEKAKNLSKLFRTSASELEQARITLIIISQVRDNIGVVSWGRSTKRSGGRALDFYASQVIYLANLGSIKKTVSGIERSVGVKIRAKVDKNKVSLPGREAEFDIKFGYGLDDMESCLRWLKECKSLHEVMGDEVLELLKDDGKDEKKDEKKKRDPIKKYVDEVSKLPDDQYFSELKRIHEVTERRWYEIEQALLPTRKKYR